VTNYLVVALDEETVEGMKQRGVNHFFMPIKVGWGGVCVRKATGGGVTLH
jgi:hypothetical protein